MIQGLRWQRLRADFAGELAAKGVALFAILPILLGWALESEVAMGIGGVLIAGSFARIVFRIQAASARRHYLVKSLDATLGADGEANVAGGDEFPDIPFWIGRSQIYCAREMDIEAQAFDQLVWIYAESYRVFGFFRRYQLALWNRSAVATVFPVGKFFRDAALERVRQAAPWLPVGFNAAMKESWNADHAEFIALIDSHRIAGNRFEAPWAGNGMAVVLLESQWERKNPLYAFTDGTSEDKKLEQRWAKKEPPPAATCSRPTPRPAGD
jgi:hypothetical protein